MGHRCLVKITSSKCRDNATNEPASMKPQMPHPDLGEDEVEITIDHDTGQVSVRGNNLEMMEEAKKMLAEIGIFVE